MTIVLSSENLFTSKDTCLTFFFFFKRVELHLEVCDKGFRLYALKRTLSFRMNVVTQKAE